jgi:hypothetical protein
MGALRSAHSPSSVPADKLSLSSQTQSASFGLRQRNLLYQRLEGCRLACYPSCPHNYNTQLSDAICLGVLVILLNEYQITN